MKTSDTRLSRISALIDGRLENSVTVIQVVNWLNNFQESEVDRALDILDKLEFFSVERIVATYSDNLRRIFKYFDDKNVIFLAVGQFAKSGTAMTYFIKQAPSFGDKRFKKRKYFASSMIEIGEIVEREKINPFEFLLILVDDFVGSGKSTVGFYYGSAFSIGLKEYLTENKLSPSLALLSIVILQEGLSFIRSEIGQIYISAEKRSKIFANRGSVFGYRPVMLPLRELAYTKGSNLVRDLSWSLGYDNSQGLIAFSHTTPNNTLPIIWSSSQNWLPLYPRFGPDKVIRFKKFREQSQYWLSLALKHTRGVFADDGSKSYSMINLQLMTIMRLKSLKRSVPVVCQIMGIGYQEYEDIIVEGNLRGIFTSKGDITKLGQDLHDQLKKTYLIRRNKEKRTLKGDDEIIYLPMTFRGET